MININKYTDKLIYVVILYSFLSLIIAYGSEYFFHIKPCALCFYQRYSIIFALTFSMLSVFVLNKTIRIYSLFLTVMSFLLNFIVAIYQILIEHKILPAPLMCRKTSFSGNNFQEFKQSLMLMKKHISCDNVSWELFGISFAGYNALFSLLLIVICIIIIKSLNLSYNDEKKLY